MSAPATGPHTGTPGETPDVDALVCDMDGLLLDTETLAMQALLSAGAEVGLEMPQSLCRSMIGVPEDMSRLLFRERHGSGVPADPLFAAAARHLEALIDDGQLRIKPGVLEMLAAAEEAGLPKAVATSSARRKAMHHLRRAGIGDRFDAILTRDDVARGKPHPDLYVQAARALETAPSRCLALEDSYNGVRAAHAAGMPVVMVPDLLAPTDEMRRLCRAVVTDLHAVIPWFRQVPGSPR
jgi:HAD superfamily hydrolase (TIGR01509 family)